MRSLRSRFYRSYYYLYIYIYFFFLFCFCCTRFMFFHLFILFSLLKKLRINLRGFKKLWICAPLRLYSAERFCIRRLQFLSLEAKNAQLTNPHRFVIQVVVSSKERTWISDTGIARIATVGFMAIFGSPVFQSPLPDTSWFFFDC